MSPCPQLLQESGESEVEPVVLQYCGLLQSSHNSLTFKVSRSNPRQSWHMSQLSPLTITVFLPLQSRVLEVVRHFACLSGAAQERLK